MKKISSDRDREKWPKTGAFARHIHVYLSIGSTPPPRGLSQSRQPACASSPLVTPAYTASLQLFCTVSDLAAPGRPSSRVSTVDVLQVGVNGAGEAGSRSAAISLQSVSLENACMVWLYGLRTSSRPSAGKWLKRRHRIRQSQSPYNVFYLAVAVVRRRARS